VDVAEGTIVVWSDIACPWATVAVHRLHEARERLGLDDAVHLDHRCFALELQNRRPTPYKVLFAELPVAGALAPEAGWQVWQGGPGTWPVTTLPALEAVQAAKAQSLAASERLDRALRRALFAESRCISMRHVVLEVAEECDTLDVDALRGALDEGRARSSVIEQAASAKDLGVDGSPHVFLPDGSGSFNPGVELHWEGDHGTGFPVVDSFDPAAYEDLVKRATPAER
jgi:predicted DsbA family dithiol-disulfide isomerase